MVLEIRETGHSRRASSTPVGGKGERRVPLILWLLGVPLSVIIILWLLGVFS
jgi:hypothetical protein